MEEIYYAFNPWWEGKPFDCGFPRTIYLDRLRPLLARRQINVIIGSRRVGKTTFLKQLIKQQLDNGLPAQQILYLALDHPRLARVPLSEHVKGFRKLFTHRRTTKLFLLLDEVQESPSWEAELKSLYDVENVKIICSGSTASLVASQGGRLTGRQIVTTLYPLSFLEFLSFKQLEIDRAEDYRFEQAVEAYLQVGGYPEHVLMPSAEYLSNLLEDIIARDLVRLFNIRKPRLLKDLFQLLAASVGSRTSFNRLAHALGLTVDTLKEYVGYFESAFLVKPLEKWSTSYTERVYASKKIYLLDTGFKTLLTGTGDLGAKAENAVFAHLLRTGQPCGYYAEGDREVDFVLGTMRSPLPLEIKYVSQIEWRDPRLAGVKLFFRRFPNANAAAVVSRDVETRLTLEGRAVTVTPLWKYLLADSLGNHRDGVRRPHRVTG